MTQNIVATYLLPLYLAKLLLFFFFFFNSDGSHATHTLKYMSSSKTQFGSILELWGSIDLVTRKSNQSPLLIVHTE